MINRTLINPLSAQHQTADKCIGKMRTISFLELETSNRAKERVNVRLTCRGQNQFIAFQKHNNDGMMLLLCLYLLDVGIGNCSLTGSINAALKFTKDDCSERHFGLTARSLVLSNQCSFSTTSVHYKTGKAQRNTAVSHVWLEQQDAHSFD